MVAQAKSVPQEDLDLLLENQGVCENKTAPRRHAIWAAAAFLVAAAFCGVAVFAHQRHRVVLAAPTRQLTVEDVVYRAKLAEQAERYEEMRDYMKSVVKATSDRALSLEERNLLSVAYKNVVGARRDSYRILSDIMLKETNKGSNAHVELIKVERERVETELSSICDDVIDLLRNTLIKESNSADDNTFYWKMVGDYYRYLAEFKIADERDDVAAKAQAAYETALKFSEQLPSTHPIRLGLALNYSVFLYEVKQETPKACQVAKDAFDKGIDGLDTLDAESYNDSTLILQLLRDNLTLWTSEDARRLTLELVQHLFKEAPW
jgi:14-3-3 protein epsilon